MGWIDGAVVLEFVIVGLRLRGSFDKSSWRAETRVLHSDPGYKRSHSHSHSHKSQVTNGVLQTFRGFACSAQILAILQCFHRRYKWAIQNTTLNEFALADFPRLPRDRCPVDLTSGSACAEVHGRNTSDRGPDVSVEFCGLPVFAAACTSVSPKPVNPNPNPVALEEKQDAEEERTLGPNPTLSEACRVEERGSSSSGSRHSRCRRGPRGGRRRIVLVAVHEPNPKTLNPKP